MAEFSKLFTFPDPLIHIHTIHPASLGGFINATPASAAWPTINLGLFVPFRISRLIQITNLYWLNGSSTSGNVDIGIYDFEGNKIISKGSTAQSGANAIQKVSISATNLPNGLYYLAIACDNTSSTFIRSAPAVSGIGPQGAGMAQMSSAFTLPSTATLVSCTNEYIPYIGLTGRSFV